MEANTVINSGLFNLLENINDIFIKNNREAILQWANNSFEGNSIASSFIFTQNPSLICSNSLIENFEPNDQRKVNWINSEIYEGETIYHPFKFTTAAVGSNEYFTVFRLAEQYLIRAEARAMQGRLDEAIADINLIRQRHGGLMEELSVPASQLECIDVILRERRVDLFTSS